MKARNRDQRRLRNGVVSAKFAAREVSFIDTARERAIPQPRIERHLTSLPVLERAAEVLRFSAARLEHWLSPGGGLRTALRRGLLLWCLLVIVGLLVAPMVTLVLGQIVAWSGLLAFVVQQLMFLPLGIAVFLLGVKGISLLWRWLFSR